MALIVSVLALNQVFIVLWMWQRTKQMIDICTIQNAVVDEIIDTLRLIAKDKQKDVNDARREPGRTAKEKTRQAEGI